MLSNLWFVVRLAWWKIWNRGDSMALVLVRSGKGYDLEFAHFVADVGKGDEYWIGKKPFYDLKQVEPEYWQDVRFLGLEAGNLVGSVVMGHEEEDVDRTLIEDLVEGSLVRAAHSNFKEAGVGFNMKWLMVGGVVLAVGYVVYKYVLGGHIPGVGGNVTVVVPESTPIWEPVSTLIGLVANL